MNRVLILLALLFCGVALAQESEPVEPTHTMTLEAQDVTPFGVTSAEFVDINFVLAEEVFYGPSVIDVEIRSGYQTTALYINLASRVNARVRIVVSNPELVISNERLNGYALYQGTQQTVNFVAFAPHSGTITVLNENDDVLAVVPYTVRHENHLRHSVNGSVNMGGSMNFSYSLSSSQGWSVGAGIGLDLDGNINGSVSGSYSW